MSASAQLPIAASSSWVPAGLVLAAALLCYVDGVTKHFAISGLGYLVLCVVAARLNRLFFAASLCSALIAVPGLWFIQSGHDINGQTIRGLAIISIWLIVLLLREFDSTAVAGQAATHPTVKADDANKLEMIAKLASRTAHDFNNSIGAIMGFASFLQDSLPRDSEEYDFALRILASANRSKDLVEEVRKLSHLALSNERGQS